MLINTCRTKKSFNDKEWKKIYDLLHQDLKLDVLPPKNKPIPWLLRIYWNFLWKKEEKIEKEFLNQSNLQLNGMKRVWEYIQIIYSINQIAEKNLRNKKIISLGAGIEPCLYAFDKLGASITASDQYMSPNYWYKEHIPYLKKTPEIFSHYQNFQPHVNYINLDLKNNKKLKKLGNFDIIYSVSSLEHIYSNFKKKKRLFKNIIKNLNKNGIFSFTTELITKYTPTRNWEIYLKYILIILKKYFFKQIKFKKILLNIKKRMNWKEIKKVVFNIYSLYRYKRRYDFFTTEELLKIIQILNKKNIYLVDKINWNHCSKYAEMIDKYKNQFYTSISLTFSKNHKYKTSSMKYLHNG